MGRSFFCKVLMFLEKKEKLLVGLTRNYIMKEVLDANVKRIRYEASTNAKITFGIPATVNRNHVNKYWIHAS